MTTPYYPYPVDYAGAAPSVTPSWSGGSRRMWLGKAGAMFEMPPSSSNNMSSPEARGTVPQQTASGATGTTILPDTVRTFSYSWPGLQGRDLAMVQMFHRRTPQAAGGPGNGPWCLVQPEGRNRLTYRQSMCGAITGAVEGWSVNNSGTLNYVTTAPYETPGGVMQWIPTAAGDSLIGANIVGGQFTPDTDHCAPYLPAEFLSFSCWVWKSSGTAQLQPRFRACNADGSGNQVISGPTVTVGTTWQQVSITVGPGAFGTLPYVFPVLGSIDGGQFRISNPVLSYTSQPLEWSQGEGVPRVVMSTDLTRDLTLSLRSGTAMVLAEAVTGAA